jgi:hypothetical protein
LTKKNYLKKIIIKKIGIKFDRWINCGWNWKQFLI